jgi:hypothetical protein
MLVSKVLIPNIFVNYWAYMLASKMYNKGIYYDSDLDQTCGALVLLSSDPWLIDNSCNMQKRSDFLCEIIQLLTNTFGINTLLTNIDVQLSNN